MPTMIDMSGTALNFLSRRLGSARWSTFWRPRWCVLLVLVIHAAEVSSAGGHDEDVLEQLAKRDALIILEKPARSTVLFIRVPGKARVYRYLGGFKTRLITF